METPDDSPAEAEVNNPADGVTPPTENAETNQDRSPEEIIAGGNADEIRALLRANNDVLVQSKGPPETAKDNWTSDEEGTDTEADTDVEATPDEEDADDSEDAPEEEEAPEANRPALPEKDPTRVRINRFAETDRLVIAHMSKNEGMSFDDARAALIEQGKIKAPAAPAKTEQPAKTEARPDPIAAQQAVIADLEAKITAAAEIFDNKEQARLQMEHNKALAALNKLELKAEAARDIDQNAAQTKFAEDEAEAKESALELFPDSGKPGTPLYEKLVELMAEASDADYADPLWPVTLAAKAKALTKSQSPPAKAKPAATPPPLVARRPARPVLPVSGSAQPAGAKRTPTPDEALQAAIASNDPVAIRAALRASGSKTLAPADA